ncbi:DNA ligase 4 [Neolecta irregularis DAH-3]|uniref:DNA ligase n=1 Tax=Neolecta irregularis (strain DAH-3) TaxID=1198029 RepID=A0A1U7LNT7_NEOID|nr:DNA ligase 4 [Neolecta irregularis DAH-3]|eukprot:OLL24314.1 DNA ligase 4 [Neolecta irregularis DAH-3]
MSHSLEDDTFQDEDIATVKRPINKYPSPPFIDLVTSLFEPLTQIAQTPKSFRNIDGKSMWENKRLTVETFIANWRARHPLLTRPTNSNARCIYITLGFTLSEHIKRDRDRPMYGIKEATLAKIFINVLGIAKDSPDAIDLKEWKQPGQSNNTAGYFPTRCFDAIAKRPSMDNGGNLTVEQLNKLLNRLSGTTLEADQLKVIKELYHSTNPEEMKWIVQIILRQMRLRTSEKLFFNLWHPDADKLFNVTSSLRKVCWQLCDPDFRLADKGKDIKMFNTFQPQLACSWINGVAGVFKRFEGLEFWIEEKLDGERIQLHKRGNEFKFFSRKGTDYTHLYGKSFDDRDSALTRHIKDAFHELNEDCILDGEMITWDPIQEAIIPFGTLKSAALSEKSNILNENGIRPCYYAFDILLLNDKSLVNYSLIERRKALKSVINLIPGRLEILEYTVGKTQDDVENSLRDVIRKGGEGLVMKNPEGVYKASARDQDWCKIKPDYMNEFGEDLDCLIIVEVGITAVVSEVDFWEVFSAVSELMGRMMRKYHCTTVICNSLIYSFHSFCRVGGGFRANDYDKIRSHTHDKWFNWDENVDERNSYIELAGNNQQFERPDRWIKPQDSVVIKIKAAQVTPSNQFKTGNTLRFPRFQRVRDDKNWESALSYKTFWKLKVQAEEWSANEMMTACKKAIVKRKNETHILGANGSLKDVKLNENGIFHRMLFYCMSGAKSVKKDKEALEILIKNNGESIKVGSLISRRTHNVILPRWIFESLEEGEALPLEPKYVNIIGLTDLIWFMLFALPKTKAKHSKILDEYGDSYYTSVTTADIQKLLKDIPVPSPEEKDIADISQTLERVWALETVTQGLGRLFEGLKIYFSLTVQRSRQAYS